MQLTFEDFGQTRVITMGESRIDAAIAIAFKDKMRELTDGGPKRNILDMTKVEFIDSSGLGAVVASLKQVDADSKLELACLSQTVTRVFRLTRMDTVFTIHANLQSALDGGMENAV
ncbi:anti-sigma B factor antagonist [Aliiroseovarius crassostreae]|uniref:Anti-sigma factor antagonist n=1 Tax=Aliiroseovarius crassostreae TaxID=154981 RepID=A0A0P7J202_9RHOB|nr:STAS domain-containing protein [Aliiroseovarius crassostreae]KPN61656.1 anti-anti-sigma factor [Aliiroseovarius crassostreae]SFU55841.1 anti-sigma B factor antagonist [Aliiroseovarius crassostreae]